VATKKKPAKMPVVPQFHGVEINLPHESHRYERIALMSDVVQAFRDMVRAIPNQPEAVIHHCNIFGGSPNGIGAKIDLPRDAEG